MYFKGAITQSRWSIVESHSEVVKYRCFVSVVTEDKKIQIGI